MKHRNGLKKFGRSSAARTALLRSLAIALLRHEKIVTTLTKAKTLRPYVEKLITRSKDGSLHSRRILFSILRNDEVVEKLISDFSLRYASRPGGYSRVMKFGFRKGDCAPMAIIELLDGCGDSFSDKNNAVVA